MPAEDAGDAALKMQAMQPCSLLTTGPLPFFSLRALPLGFWKPMWADQEGKREPNAWVCRGVLMELLGVVKKGGVAMYEGPANVIHIFWCPDEISRNLPSLLPQWRSS